MGQPRSNDRESRGLLLFCVTVAGLVILYGVFGDVRFPQLARVWGASTPSEAPPAVTTADAGVRPVAEHSAFLPPPDDAVPAGELGDAVRRGRQIFDDTARFAAPYVGNDLSCSNCHLDAGRRAGAAPLWAAVGRYPAYRAKTGRIDTLAMRLQECFTFSMNGTAPPADDPVLVALQAYASWLATGAPVGAQLVGSGYPSLGEPVAPADRDRGAGVYARQCASCHGAEGAGLRGGDRQIIPPLWGARSFNAGAGMAQAATAAAFIHANMPPGRGGTLQVQEAWDVAAFVVGNERPPDPRSRETPVRGR